MLYPTQSFLAPATGAFYNSIFSLDDSQPDGLADLFGLDDLIEFDAHVDDYGICEDSDVDANWPRDLEDCWKDIEDVSSSCGETPPVETEHAPEDSQRDISGPSTRSNQGEARRINECRSPYSRLDCCHRISAEWSHSITECR